MLPASAGAWWRDDNLLDFWCEHPLSAVYRYLNVRSTYIIITEPHWQRAQHKCQTSMMGNDGLLGTGACCSCWKGQPTARPPKITGRALKTQTEHFSEGAAQMARKAKMKVSIETKRRCWELKLCSENYRFYIINNIQIVKAWVMTQV